MSVTVRIASEAGEEAPTVTENICQATTVTENICQVTTETENICPAPGVEAVAKELVDGDAGTRTAATRAETTIQQKSTPLDVLGVKGTALPKRPTATSVLENVSSDRSTAGKEADREENTPTDNDSEVKKDTGSNLLTRGKKRRKTPTTISATEERINATTDSATEEKINTTRDSDSEVRGMDSNPLTRRRKKRKTPTTSSATEERINTTTDKASEEMINTTTISETEKRISTTADSTADPEPSKASAPDDTTCRKREKKRSTDQALVGSWDAPKSEEEVSVRQLRPRTRKQLFQAVVGSEGTLLSSEMANNCSKRLILA